MKILLVEDETTLAESIVTYLKGESYICEVAADYKTAMDKVGLYDYDCILLDISLPDGSGLSILQALKDDHKTDGVLIISAKNSLEDRLTGLHLGADDYLAKPFHLSELSARIAAIIRRKSFGGNKFVAFNDIVVDTQARTITSNKQELELTKKEYELLLFFITNKRKVISKSAIAEHLWGDEMDMADNYHFIYTHIKNLRKKLMNAGKSDYIKSIYGMGYKFTDQ